MFDKTINIPKRFKLSAPLFATALLFNSVNLSATENHIYNLSQAIDHALVNNPDLQIMEDRIAQAEAQLVGQSH